MSSIFAEIAAGLGLTLTEAARRVPSNRGGRPVHSSCISRWIRPGIRLPSGEVLRLEAAKLAGRWLTTGPALERFLERQTTSDGEVRRDPRTPGQRRNASERAAAELDQVGI